MWLHVMHIRIRFVVRRAARASKCAIKNASATVTFVIRIVRHKFAFVSKQDRARCMRNAPAQRLGWRDRKEIRVTLATVIAALEPDFTRP